MADNLEKVLDKEKSDEFQKKWRTMDEDRDIRSLVAYTLTDADGLTVDGAENVTSTDPQVTGDRIAFALANAAITPEIKVVPDDERKEAAIEGFINYALGKANKRLVKKLLQPINDHIAEDVVYRGEIGGRAIVLRDGAMVDFDVLPWDMRYVSYDIGKDGLLWGARRIKKSKSQILDEYNFEVDGDDAEIIEYWDRDVNEIWLAKQQKLLYSSRNELGVVPIVVQKVGRNGDSIYAPVRKLVAEINKTLSIMQSVNMISFQPPIAVKTEEGDEELEQGYPAIRRMVIMLQRDDMIEKIPFTEMYNHVQPMLLELKEQWQRATLPFSDFGAYPRGEYSALFIQELGNRAAQIFVPRTLAMSNFYKCLAMLICDQFKANLGVSVQFEDRDRNPIIFKPQDLEGDYDIDYHITTLDPERDIANYQLSAMAAEAGVSMHTRLRKIMSFADPVAEEYWIGQELLESTVPGLMEHRQLQRMKVELEKLSGDAKAAKQEEIKLVEAYLKTLTTPQQQPITQGMERPPAKMRPFSVPTMHEKPMFKKEQLGGKVEETSGT